MKYESNYEILQSYIRNCINNLKLCEHSVSLRLDLASHVGRHFATQNTHTYW
jgi:hypothetical protein